MSSLLSSNDTSWLDSRQVPSDGHAKRIDAGLSTKQTSNSTAPRVAALRWRLSPSSSEWNIKVCSAAEV